MDSLSLSMVVIGYCQMGHYVFQRNITNQTSSFMLIWILIWSTVGVVDWLRGQNVIIIEIYMDFGDLSLSLSYVCVINYRGCMENKNRNIEQTTTQGT